MLLYTLQATSDYGYNWTHPASPLDNPFVWRSVEYLGGDPGGQVLLLTVALALARAGRYYR